MDQPTSLVLVALIGAVPTFVNMYLGRKGRDELKAELKAESNEVKGKLTEIHKDVNGKTDQIIKLAKAGDIAQGRAEGVEQERVEERVRKQNGGPAHVIVDNTKENPAHVKPVE